MSKRMFDKHPYMKEVMTLHNLDVKRGDCTRALQSGKVLSAGKLNLIAIDICGMYNDLVTFIYLRKQEDKPDGLAISEHLKYLTRYLRDNLRTDMLEHIDTVDKWKATELPLNNIETTREEVELHMHKLGLLYDMVDCVYLPTEK